MMITVIQYADDDEEQALKFYMMMTVIQYPADDGDDKKALSFHGRHLEGPAELVGG